MIEFIAICDCARPIAIVREHTDLAPNHLTQMTEGIMRRVSEYYRVPESFLRVFSQSIARGKTGFFRLGDNATCFGTCHAVRVMPSSRNQLSTLALDSCSEQCGLRLPFNPDEIIDNLLFEKYPLEIPSAFVNLVGRTLYYQLRPYLSIGLREHFQRAYLHGWDRIQFPGWPVDNTVERILEALLILIMREHECNYIPFIWFWPKGADSCMMITHDVETKAGRDFCARLIALDASWGFRSSFQIIPEGRYGVTTDFMKEIRLRGCEVNVHDLNHDGRLFLNRRYFTSRIGAINDYGRQFGAEGFRAGMMYRNQEWSRSLLFQYDMSVPNSAHLDPQRGGCCTTMPYFNEHLLELPLTLTQDYVMFHLLKERSLALWEKQINTIRQTHGLISVLVHPDYLRSTAEVEIYQRLLSKLADLRDRYHVWAATPGEVNAWWRIRNGLRLIKDANGWRVEGPGCECASIAYARCDSTGITYQIEKAPSGPMIAH